MKTKFFIQISSVMLSITRAFAGDDGAAIQKAISDWPPRPRLGAEQMIAEYGVPQEVTGDALTWHDKGPYKRITVTKEEDHHDFPLPHTDYMQHTVSYKVPPGKADELAKFDGSLTYDKTRGLMSARCDLEGHNILTLNLANDIITGKKSVEEAREDFSKVVAQDNAGKMPEYTAKLQFEPVDKPKDSDKTTMRGAPVRTMKASGDRDADVREAGKTSGDAEILSMIIAVDMNEIVAAMEVAKKKGLNAPVVEFAKTMHTEHGKNSSETMDLAAKLGVVPLDTEKSEQLRVKGATELSNLIPMEADKFGKAYVEMMVQGHTEVIELIDKELLPKVENEALKAHLTMMREHIAMHLEKAKEINSVAVK